MRSMQRVIGGFILVLTLFASPVFAADVKISALPAADALDGTEKVPVVQAGATKRTTTSAIANFITASNGLTKTSSNVALGGTLTGDTSITGNLNLIPTSGRPLFLGTPIAQVGYNDVDGVVVAGSAIQIYEYSAGPFGAGQLLMQSRGTVTAPLISQTGDYIGARGFGAYDGVTLPAFQNPSVLESVIITGAVAANSIPATYCIATGDGATTEDRFCIDPVGAVAITNTMSVAGVPVKGVYRGVTGSVSGALTAGVCNSGTATVTGATNAMTATASPTTYPGDGVTWMAYVSSTNTVTVKECGLGVVTPTASTYQVAVFP